MCANCVKLNDNVCIVCMADVTNHCSHCQFSVSIKTYRCAVDPNSAIKKNKIGHFFSILAIDSMGAVTVTVGSIFTVFIHFT